MPLAVQLQLCLPHCAMGSVPSLTTLLGADKMLASLPILEAPLLPTMDPPTPSSGLAHASTLNVLYSCTGQALMLHVC